MSSSQRLSKLLKRAADPTNAHEATIAAEQADALAASMPTTCYLLPPLTEFELVPAAGGPRRTHRAKAPLSLYETDRVRSVEALLKGRLPFRMRIAGTSEHYIVFLPIRDVQVF